MNPVEGCIWQSDELGRASGDAFDQWASFGRKNCTGLFAGSMPIVGKATSSRMAVVHLLQVLHRCTCSRREDAMCDDIIFQLPEGGRRSFFRCPV
jgi:hypothetical protein